MKPLLTRPGPDAPTVANGMLATGTTTRTVVEAVVWHTRAQRPPRSVQALRLLLLAAAATTMLTWLWAFRGVQAYAWPGVDNGLTERALSYLLILGPAVPVNFIAAVRLARGGKRARFYVAAAGTLAVVQVLLLLTPSAMPLADTMSDGSSTVGIRHLVTVGPFLCFGVWIATTERARAWLGATPKPRRSLLGLEAVVYGSSLACALVLGAVVHQWASTYTEPLAPAGEYAEPGTWAALEQAVTETTDAIPDFSGFATRTLDVESCGYHTPVGLTTYRYLLTYELRDSAAEPIADRWNEDDFELTYDGETLAGNRRITAERDFPTTASGYLTDTGIHAITLAYTETGAPTLHLESPCVERATEPTECILPQGDPDADTIKGITCRQAG